MSNRSVTYISHVLCCSDIYVLKVFQWYTQFFPTANAQLPLAPPPLHGYSLFSSPKSKTRSELL